VCPCARDQVNRYSASTFAAPVRYAIAIPLGLIALTIMLCAQDDIPVFKTQAASAFVWGEDNSSSAISSSIRDPVTGHAIHKLKHAGVEVSSRAGFEKAGSGEPHELLSFTTTIVNNTKSELSVRQGRASVDGRMTMPLNVELTKKKHGHKKNGEQVWDLARMSCYASGFLPDEVFVSPEALSKVLTVSPRRAVTVSFVVKDPRYSSLLCSVDGCFPKGTMRFAVTVNATDFVFIWPGRSMVDCGK
jgi:hypothetical protein